ncbi:MAG: hypothetical protein ABI783_06355 [Actinomycetota bacterium]
MPKGRILTELGRMLVAGWAASHVTQVAIQIAGELERGEAGLWADRLRKMRQEGQPLDGHA